MSHFAEIDDNDRVVRVLVVEREMIDSGTLGDPDRWIQTSYNTRGGIHIFGGTPLRKNFAGIGFTYDRLRDAFIPPAPFPSWILNNETCLWEAPVPKPDDSRIYIWNESNLCWDDHTPLPPPEIPHQPYPSWTYDPVTNTWVSPVPCPDDGKPYEWNEEDQAWLEPLDLSQL